MGIQKTFMDFVEETTDKLESSVVLQPPQEEPKGEPDQEEQQEFKPKQSMEVTHEVTKRIVDIWHSIHYHADFEQWLDIVLAALERREEIICPW